MKSMLAVAVCACAALLVVSQVRAEDAKDTKGTLVKMEKPAEGALPVGLKSGDVTYSLKLSDKGKADEATKTFMEKADDFINDYNVTGVVSKDDKGVNWIAVDGIKKVEKVVDVPPPPSDKKGKGGKGGGKKKRQ